MGKHVGKWLLGISVSFSSFACLASLPRTHLCYDVVCFSMVDESAGAVRDRTYQQDSTGRSYLVVRFTNGGHLAVLIRPVPASECQASAPTDYATLIKQSETDISSRGCLAAPQAGRFFQVDFALSSPKTSAQLQLHALDPYVRITGITSIKHWSGPRYDSNTLILRPR